jgi:putative spermidine/putrescine transport system ATP-binding protein
MPLRYIYKYVIAFNRHFSNLTRAFGDVEDDTSSSKQARQIEMTAKASTGQSLLLDNITHRYGAATAVESVTLDIKGGELIALLGPSGCGKTTLLRAIGGFINQSEGHVIVGGKRIDHLPPNKRAVGIVFQNYALFPHMTAAENVAYGLQARGAPRAATRSRVEEMLSLVKLVHLSKRYPRELSGGQQQRVALARALAVNPSILLLDEPFAALDKNLRLDMQIEIKHIQRLSGTTTLIVTHDQEEALSMADRVAVFNQGRLEQFGTPSEVYDRPRSLFVNSFVGTANLLQGKLVRLNGGTADVALAIGGEIATRAPSESLAVGEAVTVCVRPEHLRISTDASGIAGTLEMGLPLGAMIVHEIRTADGQAIKIIEPRSAGTEPRNAGTAVRIAPLSPDAVTVFRSSSSQPQPLGVQT